MPKHKYSLAVVMSLLVCMFSVRANAQISFAPAQIYPLTAVPFRVVAGDLNGDGKPVSFIKTSCSRRMNDLPLLAFGAFR
jgi:hypothetical protein